MKVQIIKEKGSLRDTYCIYIDGEYIELEITLELAKKTLNRIVDQRLNPKKQEVVFEQEFKTENDV